jgi:sarcosine oxidase
VIGAGAFGGWTALELRRRGAEVTLVDAWGPGNARASSGGETRIIRSMYGSRAVYTAMALRALGLWREHDTERRLLRETGVLWMFREDDEFSEASEVALRDHGARLDRLPLADARRRYPQIDFRDIGTVFVEPAAGYLFARRACEDVVARFVSSGGTFRVAAAAGPVDAEGVAKRRLLLRDGTTLEADAFVFACGPWLPTLFPDVIGSHLEVTRQEVLYFGAPAGDDRFTDACLPVWCDMGESQIYGIPTAGVSGFKIADDRSGLPIDPTTEERRATPEAVARMRRFLAVRFPALADAPLVASEVCQYESTPDAHFIVDRHPRAPNLWIVGGGSGHGFKMGPAVGEMVASLILGDASPDPLFALARFVTPPPGGWQKKWS